MCILSIGAASWGAQMLTLWNTTAGGRFQPVLPRAVSGPHSRDGESVEEAAREAKDGQGVPRRQPAADYPV